MAKFKFSLDALLRVKQLKKKQTEGEYAKAQRELDMQQAVLSKLVDEYRGLTSDMEQLTAKGTTARHMKLYASYSGLLQRRIKFQEQVVAEASNNLDSIKVRLIGLVREVNVLSEMKERQYYQYLLETEKRYQKVVDEYAGYKIYRQGGQVNGKE